MSMPSFFLSNVYALLFLFRDNYEKEVQNAKVNSKTSPSQANTAIQKPEREIYIAPHHRSKDSVTRKMGSYLTSFK